MSGMYLEQNDGLILCNLICLTLVFRQRLTPSTKIIKIIMHLLAQYELSCILIGSLHPYYQFIVSASTKYGAVHRASNKKSKRYKCKFGRAQQ